MPVIISHRRSGTHLTIDALLNNSKYRCNNNSFALLDERDNYLETFKKDIENNSNCIVKTHTLPDFERYSKEISTDDINFLNDFMQKEKKIFIYRNGLDVMVSLHFYMKKADKNFIPLSFKEFLRTPLTFDGLNYTPPQYWNYFIEQWNNSKWWNDCLKISYEDILKSYDESIKKILKFIDSDIKTSKIKDVRLNTKQTKINSYFSLARLKKIFYKLTGKKMTSVSVRKGIVGDYKNYFDTEDYEYFFSHAENAMKMLGYETKI